MSKIEYYFVEADLFQEIFFEKEGDEIRITKIVNPNTCSEVSTTEFILLDEHQRTPMQFVLESEEFWEEFWEEVGY